MLPAAIIGIYSIAGHVITEAEYHNRHKKLHGLALKRRTKSYATGALERRNPLPVGRYWIDIFEPKKEVFYNWLRIASISVQVLATETREATDQWPASEWYLFETKQMLMWDIAGDVGWPTVAGPEVKTSDDTVQKPKPEGLFKNPSFETKVVIGGAALLLAAVAVGYAVRSFK